MKLLTRILVTLAFSFADAFFGFAFYFRWNKYDLFRKDLTNYCFAHSMFELWLFSAIRVVLLMGAIVGLLSCKEDSVKCIKVARYPVGLNSIFMVIFTLVKIMLYTEFLDGNHGDEAWFLSLAAWTMVASLAIYGLWVYILQEAGSTVTCNKELHRMHLINGEKMRESERSASQGSDNTCDDSYHTDGDGDDDDDDDDYRQEKQKKLVQRYSTFFRLLSYSAPDWLFLLVAFAALITGTAGKVFLPKLTGHLLDGVVIKDSKDKPELEQAIILMTSLSVVVALTSGIRSGFFTLTTARLSRRVTKHLFDSILKQELGFFDKTTTGAITSCLISDVATMSDTLGVNINNCLQNLFELIGNLVFMVIISWRLTIITIISFPLLTIITDVFGSYYQNLSRTTQSILATATSVAGEAIATMKTVRSFANEEGEKKSYRLKLNMTYLLRRKGAAANGVAKVFSSLFTLMMFVGTLFYGGHLVEWGMLSGGMLVSYILYQQQFGSCLENIIGDYSELMKATGASRKVFELIDRIPKFMNEGRLAPRKFEGHVEFKNVSFAYPTEPSIPVLKDVSFQAYPGEVLALVGPSGGGKSSCISLIEHFYEPTSGQVLIDGKNVKDYDHAYLHEKVALVGQEPVLYARSIHENISYSLNDCNTERIQHAAKQANAHNFIMQLKKGYQTEAGEKGLHLSGGQKQRVAIARALVRNPQVLLLDEATSALDAQSEHLVQQALTRNFGSRTVIIVAHRLSTIEKANRIVVIDQGTVVEQGKHQDLIRSDGLYATLVRRQVQGYETDEESDFIEVDIERK